MKDDTSAEMIVETKKSHYTTVIRKITEKKNDSTEQALWNFVIHQAILASAEASHRSSHTMSSTRKKKG